MEQGLGHFLQLHLITYFFKPNVKGLEVNIRTTLEIISNTFVRNYAK